MPIFTRRNVLLAGGAAVAAGVVAARKPDHSGPRDPYFEKVQSALHAAGIAQPVLVIDKTRLNANVDQILSDLPDGMNYRIVSKSVPSLDLIKHVRARSGSKRLMTFNLPMLLTLSQEMSDAGQLLGKPLPAQAAKNYFSSLPSTYSEAANAVQWLIDSPARLNQYAQISAANGTEMAINIELDVGLHRGGMVPGDALNAMMVQIKDDPNLRFAGFMGYEPHLAALPTALGLRKKAKRIAWETYQDALSAAHQIFPKDVMAGITRNTAGSPTYRLYKDTEIANEISVGSALVKPGHYDTELLEPFVPAMFIATPVIKTYEQTNIPGLEVASGVMQFFDANLDKTVFIYGGNWLAHPHDPPGLQFNDTFGRSSNQEMLNGGANITVTPDDFVFLRPDQSEAVMLQFGDIAVYEEGEIVEFWPVFTASA